jgi:hypothetical protein
MIDSRYFRRRFLALPDVFTICAHSGTRIITDNASEANESGPGEVLDANERMYILIAVWSLGSVPTIPLSTKDLTA